jgi:hypothetical protein
MEASRACGAEVLELRCMFPNGSLERVGTIDLVKVDFDGSLHVPMVGGHG